MKKELSKIGFILISICLNQTIIFAQGTLSDYNRADELKEKFSNKVYYGNVEPSWAGNSSVFTYENTGPDGKDYLMVNPHKKKKEKAFKTDKLAAKMAMFTKKEIDAGNLPIRNVSFHENLKSFSFEWNSKEWICSLPSYKLESGDSLRDNRRSRGRWVWNSRDESSAGPIDSPNGELTAYIKNYNVFIRSKDEKEVQISFDGGLGEFYSSLIKWSPDSKMIMAYKVRPAEKHMINYIESSPAEQLQPIHYAYQYTKPGDALPQFYPQLFELETEKHIKVDGSIIPEQYNLNRFNWSEDSRSLTYEYNKRGHQLYQVIRIDAANGNQKIIISEKSKTFIDYSGKRYRYDINDGEKIIWASERDGWNHLYLYDGRSGEVIKQITRGEWLVRDVEHVDTDNSTIIFTASGKEEGDPYFIHYYIINFDGTGLRRLTAEEGNHKLNFSPDRKFYVDTWSTINTAPIATLKEIETGKEVMPLEKADISKLISSGWKAPEVFTAKGRDGITDIWGIIIRPSNFNPQKKYPVIEYIYAGPHSSFVPKSFRPYIGHIHPLAELGFIIVQIDGMGTSNRSKSFHDVCWKNIKDAGFPDRILWMKAAAKKYSEMDISKVGIYGTSAGGQNSTGALLFHPTFYSVGVSSCGCHDNRMDKIWWNEQWMGWPIGPEYAQSSNIENANKLEGKLLLINGEMDFNVDPASTTQLVNSLIKANKDFDYIFIPGMGHSSGGEYGEHKRRDFFVRHMLGVSPPEWKLFDK